MDASGICQPRLRPFVPSVARTPHGRESLFKIGVAHQASFGRPLEESIRQNNGQIPPGQGIATSVVQAGLIIFSLLWLVSLGRALHLPPAVLAHLTQPCPLGAECQASDLVLCYIFSTVQGWLGTLKRHR